jgi:hypothetical protein
MTPHFYLASALVGGEWSASRSGRFTPGERAPFTHWIGVDPRARLDDVEKRVLLMDGFFIDLFFDPEDGDVMFVDFYRYTRCYNLENSNFRLFFFFCNM